MFNVPAIEWVGYCASTVVAISLLMTSIIQLRIINSIGCMLFVFYGLSVGAYPVAVANVVIIVINLYKLYKLYNPQNNIFR